MALTLYLGNDTLVTWDKMTRASDGAYVNDATVTMTLYDSLGVAVTGAINVSLPYVASSDGKYQGTIESTADIDDDSSYSLVITATSGSKNGQITLDCVAKTRTS